MKVLMINGSPRKSGHTFAALSEIAKELHEQGIDSEIMQIGTDGIHGCTGCRVCRDRHSCVLIKDIANEYVMKVKGADGLIVGSPVCYVSANGGVVSLLGRMFYMGGSHFTGKLAAIIASARRAGITTIINEMNKYSTISQMPVVSPTHWNTVHGGCVEGILKDEEGLQTMRNPARNMAWLLKYVDCGKQNDIEMSKTEKDYRTNFIR